MNWLGFRRGGKAEQAYRTRGGGGMAGLRGWQGPSSFGYENLGGEEAYFSSPVVYACVQRISNQLASMPRSIRSTAGRERTPPWVEEPNGFMGGNDLIRAITASLLLAGEAFVVPFRGGKNMVRAVAVVNPEYVHHWVRADGVQWFLNGEEYRGEMIHMRHSTLPARIRGVSGLDVLKPLTKTSASAQEYVFQAVERGGAYQMAYTFPDEVTDDYLEETLGRLIAAHSGPKNAYRPLLLGGNAKVVPVTQSNADSGFLDLSRMTDKEIAAYGFNLDPTMLALPTDEPQTYRNEPGTRDRFWQLALKPVANEIQRGLSLLAERGWNYVLDPSEMLLGGPHDRGKVVLEMAQTNKTMGVKVFTEDELRKTAGLYPLEEYEPLTTTTAPPEGGLFGEDETMMSDEPETTDDEDDDEEETEDDGQAV